MFQPEKLNLIQSPIPKFSPGEYVPVSISKFFDINHVYLRFVSHESSFRKHQISLRKNCRSELTFADNICHTTQDKSSLQLIDSIVFIWRRSEEDYYRAQVLDILPMQNAFWIHLIDEGYSVLADEVDLFSNIGPNIISFPIQAYKFALKLDDISCLASLMRQKHILNYFIRSLNSFAPQQLWYVRLDSDSFWTTDDNLVELYLKSNSGYISINDIMKSFIEQYPFDFDDLKLDELDNSIKLLMDMLNGISSSECDSTSNHSNNGADYSNDCNGFTHKVTDLNGGDSAAINSDNNSGHQTLDKELLPEFELNNHRLKVKQVFDPNRFFVKSVNKEDKQFDAMSSELDRYCKFTATVINDMSSIIAGHYYAARLPTSGKWARVKVLGENSDSVTFSCWFVDKGTIEDLSIGEGEFCDLEPRFRKLSPRSICASLDLIEPKSGEWSSDAVEFFAEEVPGDGHLEIIPVFYNADSNRLHCFLLKHDVNISELLIELGFAMMSHD